MRNREMPVLLAEQYALGELTEKQKAALEKEFGVEKLMEIKRQIEQENLKFFSEHPSIHISLPDTDRKVLPFEKGKRRHFFTRPSFFVPLSAAAALLLVFLGILPFIQSAAGSRPGAAMENRIKGAGPQLFIYRQTLPEPELLPDKAPVQENDVLQIKFNTGSFSYGVILSIDGRGSVTILFPEDKETPAALKPYETDTLNYGYQLDDAPAFERFFLITSDREFELGPVVKEARRVAGLGKKAATTSLKLPKGLDQSSILLEKKGNTNE
ncbi:MAG: hypothetical protein E4H36_06200 [Spirochaetales bacterium]|nr:MAG: hypothetical protein E4H36_06200 [Spirochaetales bacterium]